VELGVAQPVLLGPGEGEQLGGYIVVKLELPEVSVNEVNRSGPFEGASPHFHKEHVDVFFVLEGELEILNGTEWVRAGAGTSVAVPPGIVHGFRGPSDARYLNIHAPDGGFIEYIRRATGDGVRVDWDSYDVEEPYGPADAIVTGPSEGERMVRSSSMANTIRAETSQISLFEMEIDTGWEGVDPHSHDDHIDAFFVLDGEVEFFAAGETVRVGAGTFFGAPLHVEHGFRPVGPARIFNLHAPDAGFAGRVRSR
jgi:mannose-6-phosphate isomerase-like protein (cupin superfamily)